MWWKKEIDDHNTLILMRISVAIMYLCIAFYLSYFSDTSSSGVQGLKIVSNFYLMLAFVTLFPVVESTYTAKGKSFVNMLSVASACFVIFIMHIYLFNSFGMSKTYSYIFTSFWFNVIVQSPVVYLTKKVYAK